jgi:hypothetical protein
MPVDRAPGTGKGGPQVRGVDRACGGDCRQW